MKKQVAMGNFRRSMGNWNCFGENYHVLGN